MKTVSARQANHEFSKLLSRVERGEEILITKRNKPVAVLSPYRPMLMSCEREKAIQRVKDAIAAPDRTLTPTVSMPSSAMQTVMPANRTVRPEVAAEIPIASAIVRPRRISVLARVRMNSE